MNLSTLPYLIQILEDTQFLLKKSSFSFLFQKEKELSPEHYNLSFQFPVAEKTVETMVRSNACTSCSRRISYKPRQLVHQDFKESIEHPYLVLIHNSFLDSQQENSKRKYYQDSLTNDWLYKIFQGVFLCPPQKFLIREALRCHFGTEDIKNREWQQNCMEHIHEDIIKYSIKGILILGEAAPLLFGKNEAMKKMGQVFQFAQKPAIISSGPARLAFFQKNNYQQSVIMQEKKNIFASLSLFKKEVMKL